MLERHPWGRILETWRVDAKGKGLTDSWAHVPTIIESDPVGKHLPFTHDHWMNSSHDESHWTGSAYPPPWCPTLPSTVPCCSAHHSETWPPTTPENAVPRVTWSPLRTPCCRGGEGWFWPKGHSTIRNEAETRKGLSKAQKSTTPPSQPHLEAFLLSRRICMQISQSVCLFSLQKVLKPWHERKSRETG